MASHCLPLHMKANTCKTAFVVFRNGLPKRRGTSSLWPMSRMTKSVGMYVSRIFTKMSIANPSGFRKVWSPSVVGNLQWTKVHLMFYYMLPWTCSLQGRSRRCGRHAGRLSMWLSGGQDLLSRQWMIYMILVVFPT
jgi:hypothetical protein